MRILKKYIECVTAVTNPKDVREQLRAVCFDFDTDKNILNIVATDSQVLICYSLPVSDDDVGFCKKWFLHKAFIIPDLLAKSKDVFADFVEIDGRLNVNGVFLQESSRDYPNWRPVIPTKNLALAKMYCGFNKDLIKKADKAFGCPKDSTVMLKRPQVNADDLIVEHLNPHLWTETFDSVTKTLVVMPLRIS